MIYTSKIHDPDLELEFELNSDMGMVCNSSFSELCSPEVAQSDGKSYLDDPIEGLEILAYPGNYEQSAILGTQLTFEVPEGLMINQAQDDGHSLGQIIEDLHRLGSQLQENARQQITSVGDSDLRPLFSL